MEVFDSDRLGKDKSLGSVEICQDDLIGDEPKWYPLKVLVKTKFKIVFEEKYQSI